MRLQHSLFAILLAWTACAPALAPLKERKDEPGAAAAYYSMKRQGAANPHERYAAARAQMARMASAPSVASVNSWTFLGPGNIGGRTRTLVIDPEDDKVMYAGGVSGGVWKTVDGGERWEPIGDVLTNLAVNAMAVDPRDRRLLYVGTGEGYFREEVRGTGLPLRGNGIYLTRDSGRSWQHLPSTAGEDFHWVNDLVVSVHDSNRIYAATRTGIWRSADAGQSWTRVLDPEIGSGCLDLAGRTDAPGDYLYASCGTFEQATVYRTTQAESDDPWTAVLREPHMGRTTLAIAPSRPSTIYALSASNEEGISNQGLLAVFRSDESGDPGTWSATVRNTDPVKLNSLLLTNPAPASYRDCGGSRDTVITMGWYCNVIAVDPQDPERVWAAGVDLFRSDDGGKNWGLASYWWTGRKTASYVHADQHGILFHPRYDGENNQTMFALTDGGVFRTDNARAGVATGQSATCQPSKSDVRFTSLNHNFGATQFYHGAVSPDGRTFIGGTQDNGTLRGRIEAGSDGWEEIWGGDGGYVVIDPGDPDIIFAESQWGSFVRSTDGGNSFGSARAGLEDDFLFITPLAVDPTRPSRLWTGGRRLWRWSTESRSWWPASTTVEGKISAIAVAPRQSDRVIAGTSTGAIYRTNRGTSADGATVWERVSPRQGWISWIAFDPVDANVVYATYAGFGGTHVWKSVDGGASWSPLDGELPDIPVHSIAVDPTRRDRLYLGTDLGVFVSLDGGRHWNVENTGFAPAVTETVLIVRGSIYAFTHGRGVWRAELPPSATRRRGVRR